MTLVSAPLGTFSGVKYTRYEAMFEGQSSNGRPYRVPCQIVTPRRPGSGRPAAAQSERGSGRVAAICCRIHPA